MPFAILVPAGAGSATDFAAYPSGTTWAATADDSDTTYATNNLDDDALELHTLTALPADASAIVSVSIDLRFKAVAGDAFGAQMRPVWKLGGTTVNGTTRDAPSAGFGTFQQDIIARPGGGSWLVADFATLEAGYEAVTVDVVNDDLHVARLWLIVEYTASATEWAPAAVTATLTRSPASVETLTRSAARVETATRAASHTAYLGEED